MDIGVCVDRLGGVLGVLGKSALSSSYLVLDSGNLVEEYETRLHR